MDWLDTIKKLAPTVASALGGPLAGVAVTAIGELFGIAEPTKDKIKGAIENAQLTGQQIADLRSLELKLKSEEAERGFKYAELEFKDRDSARNMMIQTGAKTPAILTWLITSVVLALEGYILFKGIPSGVNELVLGRVLGTLDTSLGLVLAYWFGTSHGSSRKTDLMAGSIK